MRVVSSWEEAKKQNLAKVKIQRLTWVELSGNTQMAPESCQYGANIQEDFKIGKAKNSNLFAAKL